MIQFENVVKEYHTADGNVLALDGVGLSIPKGQFAAVRGPSGCGKSTLLTIAGGLGRPSSGRVAVDGEDLVSMSTATRNRFRASQIGFVFQTFHLLPYLSVLENVIAAALPGESGDSRERAGQLLEEFHLSHRLTHRPSQLSIGECQRVAMARALVNNPKLILADEPTGNLDPENSTAVLDLLAAFHQSGGTIMLVTHQEQASKYAERTILLRDGQVESDGLSA